MFAERAKAVLKSLGIGGPDDPNAGKTEPDLTEPGDGTTDGGEMNKSNMLDATEIISDLVTELKDINKSLKAVIAKQETLEKSQTDVGEAVVAVSEVVGKIAGMPISTKSVMNKGNLNGSAGAISLQPPKTPPTQEEFERAQDVLRKSVQAGEIDMLKAEMISSDMQKSMAIPGYTMKPEYFAFLARKMQAA